MKFLLFGFVHLILFVVSLSFRMYYNKKIYNRNKNINMHRLAYPYPPDDDEDDINAIYNLYGYKPLENETNKDIPLYIVIWDKSEKTEKLLYEMEKQGLHTYFMEDSFDVLDNEVKISSKEMPTVYKNEVLLDSWMEIYAEMYPM